MIRELDQYRKAISFLTTIQSVHDDGDDDDDDD